MRAGRVRCLTRGDTKKALPRRDSPVTPELRHIAHANALVVLDTVCNQVGYKLLRNRQGFAHDHPGQRRDPARWNATAT